MSSWKVIMTSIGLGVLLYWGWKKRSNLYMKEKEKLKKRRLSKKDEDDESLVEEPSNSILKASEELKTNKMTQATDETGIGDVNNIENKTFYRNISSEDSFIAELEHFHIDIQYKKTHEMKLFLSKYNSMYGDYFYNGEKISAAATAIKYKNFFAYDLLVSIGSYSNPSITYYTDYYFDEELIYSIRDIHDKYAKSLVKIHENVFEHDYLKSLYNKCKLSFCTPGSKVIEFSASIAKILKKVSETHRTFELALKILDTCEGLEIFFDFETKNLRMINPCLSESEKYNKISIDIKERKIYCLATNVDDERFLYEICEALNDFAIGIVNNIDDHSRIKNRFVTKVIDFDIFNQQLPFLRLKQNLNEHSEIFKTLNLIPKDRQYMRNALAGLRPDYGKSNFLMSNHPLLQMYKYFYDIRFKGIFVTIDDLLNDEYFEKLVNSFSLISNPYIVIHCISKTAEMLKSIQQKLTESGIINRYTFLLDYNRIFAVNIPIQVDSIDKIHQFRNESIEEFDALLNKHENDKKKLELQILDIRETLKMQTEQKEHAMKLIEQKEIIKDNQYDPCYERTFIHHLNFRNFKISGNKILCKVNEERFKAVFISGEAGIGTTTELKQLKKQIDENAEWKYTLFLDLTKLDDDLICGVYEKYPLRCRSDIINFFCENKIIAHDDQELFQYSFNHGLVSFFMDGFSDQLQSKIIKELIKAINNLSLNKQWITTYQPHDKECFGNNFIEYSNQSTIFTLQPFPVEEEGKFYRKFLKEKVPEEILLLKIKELMNLSKRLENIPNPKRMQLIKLKTEENPEYKFDSLSTDNNYWNGIIKQIQSENSAINIRHEQILNYMNNSKSFNTSHTFGDIQGSTVNNISNINVGLPK